MKIKDLNLLKDISFLSQPGLKVVNTINAHSFNVANKDLIFSSAMRGSTYLLADGVSIVLARKIICGDKEIKIAGADLFEYKMKALNLTGGKCFFLGSSDKVLKRIAERTKVDYPNIEVCTFSPPYVSEFTEEMTNQMITKVNRFSPDLLWVGMTAPKQEKWVFLNYKLLDVKDTIGCIGAVFDFYAGTIKRAPKWMINIGLEWFFRLVSEPKRMWRRYLIGNAVFVKYVTLELIKK